MNKYFKISLYSRLKDFWFLCNQGSHSNWLISQLLLKKFLHFHMFQNLWIFLKTNTDEFSIWQLLSRESTFALSKWKFGSILSNGHHFSPRNSVWKKKYQKPNLVAYGQKCILLSGTPCANSGLERNRDGILPYEWLRHS